MKKAILLLGMILFTVSMVWFRNADADTILIDQRVRGNRERTETSYLEKEEILPTAEEQETETAASTEESGGRSGILFLELSIDEQALYTQILSSLLSLEKETVLPVKDKSMIDKVFSCVMLDHPEIFYVDGYKYTEYSYGGVKEKIVFSGNYIYDDEEIKSRMQMIDAACDQILLHAPDTEDEYEKVRYIYETIIENTTYDSNASDNQNICSVFLNARSVCQGYAKAAQYLFHRMGMDSLLVTGTVKNGDGHAWNLVSVNGQWYYMDATWGDAYYLFGNEDTVSEAERESINYDYLCVTTEQILKTHTIDMPVILPECTCLTDNYYVREGLYFEQYDEERIRRLFEQAGNAGKETVTIKCADENVYGEVREELLDKQKIFDLMQTKEGTVAYTDNTTQCSITFWLHP